LENALPVNVPLRVADGIMACELGEGLALLHRESGTFYILGEVEAFIWNRLSTPATHEGVAGALKDAYDGAPQDIERDVREFLQSMLEAKLCQVDAVVPA
jgi:hypothetical protein